MRRTLFSFTAILAYLAAFGLLGCGSGGDPLDEVAGSKWTISHFNLAEAGVEPEEDSTMNDLDVFQDVCDIEVDDDNVTTITYEPFTGTNGLVVFTSAADAPFLQIESYRMNYYPVQSPLLSGGTDLPPTLDEPGRVQLSIDIPPSSKVVIPIPNVLTIDNKAYYWFTPGGADTFIQGLYSIQITFEAVAGDEDISITRSTVVRLMNVDRCED
jgi:hypothetical protein